MLAFWEKKKNNDQSHIITIVECSSEEQTRIERDIHLLSILRRIFKVDSEEG